MDVENVELVVIGAGKPGPSRLRIFTLGSVAMHASLVVFIKF
jgi:hypothetical protein